MKICNQAIPQKKKKCIMHTGVHRFTHLLWSNCSTNPGAPSAILRTSITRRSDWKLAYSLMSDIGCGGSGMVPVSASTPAQRVVVVVVVS